MAFIADKKSYLRLHWCQVPPEVRDVEHFWDKWFQLEWAGSLKKAHISINADNGYFIQDDSAVLYALLWLRGEAKALKLEKKTSMKRLSWLLMRIGK